jgi:putative two-component system response regulator
MTGKTERILVVDDEPRNRILLETMLKPEGYSIICAQGGREALSIVAGTSIDLILLDVMMPDMDGYHVAGALKADPRTRNIPIIMVSAQDHRGARLAGLNAGAEDFLTKPVDRAELWVRVRNLLRLKAYGDLLENNNQLLEQEVQLRTAKLRESYIESIFTMTRAAEYKDEDTGTHVRRISFYSKYLAEALGMDSVFTDNIFFASPMHDIGKIGIPDHILLKPGKHTAEESVIMRTHSALGADILGQSDSPYMMMGAEIALNHHERWDGTGYPNGIKGEDIPLSGRIMAICDVYDALRSQRPYKPSFDHDKALRIITEGDGRTEREHFDPAVIVAFEQCAGRFNEIFHELAD